MGRNEASMSCRLALALDSLAKHFQKSVGAGVTCLACGR